MPDPFLIILALTAIATVLLWPVRMWILSRYDRDDGDQSETPDAPPERRHRG